MIAIVVIWYLDIILVIRDMIDSVVNMINTMILGNLPIYIYHQLLGNNTHIYIWYIDIIWYYIEITWYIDILISILNDISYYYDI